MSLLQHATASVASDYTASVVQALVVLALTAALAYLSLRFGAARGLLPGSKGKQLEIEERMRLDAKNQLLIVRVEGKRLLVATHAQGAAQLLLELPADSCSRAEPRASTAAPPPARDGSG
jgi:flagellar biogenesis protein FliO